MDRRTFVRAALAGIASLAGCVGGGGPGERDADVTTDRADPAATTVSMADTAFEPVRASIRVGGTVTWQNEDAVAHDVTASKLTDAGTDWSFESATVPGGESVQHTFEDAGAYEYGCTIHGVEAMCGVILVGDPAYDATLPCEADDSGSGYY